MEDIPNWIRALIPLLLFISGIIFVLIKNHFITKNEFKDFKEKHYIEHKELEGQISKQGRDIVEIKTDVKHMAKSLHNIEDFVVGTRKKRKD